MARRRDHTIQVIRITEPIPHITQVATNLWNQPTVKWKWLQIGQVLVYESYGNHLKCHEYDSEVAAAQDFDLDDSQDNVVYDAGHAATPPWMAPPPPPAWPLPHKLSPRDLQPLVTDI